LRIGLRGLRSRENSAPSAAAWKEMALSGNPKSEIRNALRGSAQIVRSRSANRMEAGASIRNSS